jgi:GrpB-like predicted nucleotidyltransferase (UPF0157 family)
MPTHPLWRPFALADLDAAAAGLLAGASRPVVVTTYDDAWPAAYADVAERIRTTLGERVLHVQHVGSTSDPGLAAKPIIDIDLVVADSADEAAYVPALERIGFVLRRREPDWDEHRLLAIEDPPTNLHVFGPGSHEPARTRMFRDWLRAHPEDRQAYAALKTALATRGFADGMDYNNHKAGFVYDLYEKAFGADPDHDHDPQPR